MPDKAIPDKQPRRRETKGELSEDRNGATHAAPTPPAAGDPIRAERLARAMAEAQEAVDSGEAGPQRSRGSGVVDPRDYFVEVPKYTFGQLPEVYENFVADACAAWGGDPGAYATMFLPLVCSALHSTVKVNTNPLKPEVLRNPNEHAMPLAKSGENKSGMLKDLTRHLVQWQKAMPKAPPTAKGRARFMPRITLQMASVEGAVRQIVDNRGARLTLTSEEGMGLLRGAGAHRGTGANDAVNHLITTAHDGGMYSHRLVNELVEIDECLATLMLVGVFTDMVGWDGFAKFVSSGAAARFSFGLIAHPTRRDSSKLIKGAEAAMHETLGKVRALRHVEFRMGAACAERWERFVEAKEGKIRDMVEREDTDGLINWCRKYDIRIMSMAVALQAIKFIGDGACTTEHVTTREGNVEVSYVRTTVEITEETLAEAVAFVEGYLLGLQDAFYQLASGVSEFGKELLHFLAYRVTRDEPDNPACRVIERKYLTLKGPASVRGAPEGEREEKGNRYIKALLSHGYIEVFDHPQARNERRVRKDYEERWFKVRDEVFEYFGSEGDGGWLKEVYERSRAIGERLHGPKGATF